MGKFCLSDKMKPRVKDEPLLNKETGWFFKEKDVKQFIRELKVKKFTGTLGEKLMVDFFNKRIDELAGEGLT